MSIIRDYPCSYNNGNLVGAWAETEAGLVFPRAYEQREEMVKLAKCIQQRNQSCFCMLPFCHTLEAEALGGHIVLGGVQSGPRVRQFAYASLDELEKKLQFNWELPRLQETVEACRALQEEGERILFQISGPLTILGSLLPPELLYRAMRKEPQRVQALFERIGTILLQLMKQLEVEGISLFSYADPMSAVNLIGPKPVEWLCKEFTRVFLQQMDLQLQKETLIFLCPKTALALIGTDCAHWKEHPLQEPMLYQKVALALQGDIRFVGESCINRSNYEIECIKELCLEVGVC